MEPSKKHVFQPRARLMQLLGDQLIRDSGIAVFELVKNAYDADASSCRVTLEHVHTTGGIPRIIVEDNGTGMSRETVERVWLEPGTDNRWIQRENGTRSKKYKRLPLGEKGVGRFAAHKLGNTLRIITRSRQKPELVISIDWLDFERNQYLKDVPISINEREPSVFTGRKTGTRIEICNLREHPWSRGQVRNLHRAVAAICSPFETVDDFSVDFDITPESDILHGLLTPNEVIEHAMFIFNGKIDGSELSYDYEFDPPRDVQSRGVDKRRRRVNKIPLPSLGRDEHESKDDLLAGQEAGRIGPLDTTDLGSIEVKFYIFDLESKLLKMSTSDPRGLRQYLKENGGIRVYRDSVRVYDFGEPGNDWLDLGGQRINVPARRIGNNQVLGLVSLSLENSKALIEKTNREGFVENKAFTKLRQAIGFAVAQAAAERNEDKRRIRKAFAKSRQEEPVVDELETLRESLNARGLEEEFGSTIDRVIRQYRDITERLLVAAGAGMNLAVVLHELERSISVLTRLVSEGGDLAEIERQTKLISEMTNSVSWLLRQSPAKTLRASEIIKHVIKLWRFRFKTHEIEIFNGFDVADDPDFQMHFSRRMLMTALLNIIDNAIYWLGTKSKGRKLYIGTSYELDGKPAIVIADNGPGLLDTAEEITAPFFTRRPDGIGLGLHITSEIMKEQRGRVAFPEKGDISLPKVFGGAVVLLEFDSRT